MELIARAKLIIKTAIIRLIPAKLFLQLTYYYNVGRFPDLKHPKTFNEKIQWLKLFDFKPIHTTISDKLACKEFIKLKCGDEFLIPTYAVYNSINEINLANLPKSFIIKSNNESGKNYVVYDKDDFSPEIARRKLENWNKKYHYLFTREKQYRDIEPKLFAEKLLLNESGAVPYDYKFYCFHGKVEAIQVDIDRLGDHRMNFYSRDWDLLPFTLNLKNKNWPNGNEVIRPSKLDDMIALSESLSKDFPFLRVDLYLVDDKIYLGELTLHPGSGLAQFKPESYDLYFGNLI